MRPQFCPLTGVSVDASRAGSRVDFTSTCCRVAPTRGSLLQSKRYLSRSSPLVVHSGNSQMRINADKSAMCTINRHLRFPRNERMHHLVLLLGQAYQSFTILSTFF